MSADRGEAAEAEFQKGVKLGRNLKNVADEIESIACFQRALELDPEGHRFVKGHLAWACHRNGQFDRAADLYLEILEESPNLDEAVHLAGLSLLKARRGGEASPHLLKAARSRLPRAEGWKLLFYGVFYKHPLLQNLFRIYHNTLFRLSAVVLSVLNALVVRSRFGTGAYYRWCIRNCRYESPPTSYHRAAENEFAFNLLAPEVGETVLDIGTGDSPFIPFAASRGVRMIGSDPDAYIAECKQNCDPKELASIGECLSLFQADGAKLPFADESIAKVLSISTIEHIPEEGDRAMMREISRVLAPGGRAVVTTEGGNEYAAFWQVKSFHIGRAYDFGALDKMPPEDGDSKVGFYRIYDPKNLLRRLADSAELELVESGFLLDRFHARGWYPEFPETLFQRILSPIKGLHGWMGFKKHPLPIPEGIDLTGSIGYLVLEKPRKG